MTQLIVGVAGAAVGFAIGGPVGAQIGFGIGSAVGASIGPGQNVQGPRLDPLSLRAPKLQYGARWPRVKGRTRTAGIHVWQSDLREVATEAGGKGGPSVETTTYTYYRDVIIGLAGGYYPTGAIARVWVNDKLVYSVLEDSPDDTVTASADTIYWAEMRFYNGAPGQLPDPVYEAAVGTADAIAFRRRAYVFLENVNQGGYEQLPLIEFEFFSNAVITPPGVTPPTIGKWMYRGPQTSDCGIPTSGYTFDTPGLAAAAALPIWIPCYLGTSPIPCDNPGWYFVTTGTQTPPSNAVIIAANGILQVQYTCRGNGGQIGTVEAVLTPVEPPLATVSPVNVDLADVVREECEWNGLAASKIDVTQLAGYEVYGLACAGSARESIEFLMPAYAFQAVCSNVVQFVMLGGASVASIAFADTGVSVDASNDTPFVGPARDNDTEVAAKVALTYTNFNADYDNGTEQADRLIGVSNRVDAITLPLVWLEALAKGAAETIAARGRTETMGGSLQLADKHAKLQPTDPITATDDAGTQYRLRIEETLYADGVYDHRYVRDSQAAIQRSGITNNSYTPSIIVLGPGEAELVLIDGPLLRDSENDSGFYAAVEGTGNYRGATLFKSSDGTSYASAATFTDNAAIGMTSTALGNWTGGHVFDETNSTTVDMGTDTLSSSTRDAMLLDQSVNAAAIGADGRWEIIQYRDAVLVSADPNVYTLRGLLRGRRGTEWAVGTHTATDTFVLLRTAGIRRVAMDSSELGMIRYWKAAPSGTAAADADAQTMSNDGVALKPFAPVDLRAARAVGGDITFTWLRRTRLADRFGGPIGDSVPLGEASESYDIDIFSSGAYTTVVRTITATSATASYTSAMQTTDFGSPQATVYAKVFQRSAIVGRGYELRQAA